MATPKNVELNKVFEAAEFDILTGVLKPRERLIETDCMLHYQTNRNTIRKVFKDLELKKLVKHYPNRGVMVAELSEKEIADIVSTRVRLESWAADMVVKNSSSKALNRIRQHHSEFVNFIQKKNFRGTLISNIQFHQTIFQLCGNDVLSEIIDQLRTRSHLLRHYIWRQPRRLEKSIEEHEDLIKAIENGDAERLRQINERHITAGVKNYIEDIKSLKPEIKPKERSLVK